jgi:prephenate dehydrogenase
MRPALHLAEARVAILGMGLMGGSLAMALRDHCRAVLGCDTDPETLALARRSGIVDIAEADPAAVLYGSNLVILATPVRVALDLIGRLPELHPGAAVVLDLCSSKSEIMRAMASLPERFDALGGHPMCGKESFGLAHADSAIFRGAAFALIPLEGTSPAARLMAEELVQTIGASPLWLDAATHDTWVAATSHMPYLLASALTLSTPLEAQPLVSTGFLSTARLAASEPNTMLDILITNREKTLEELTRVQNQLRDLEMKLTENDQSGLKASLQKAQSLHSRLASRSSVEGKL